MRQCPCCSDNGSQEKHKRRKKRCFLCLREDNGGDDKEGEMSEVNFRNICRYLKILPESLNLKGIPTGKPEPTKNGGDSISVLLCSSCSSLTQNLSSLIAQMETVQILVTHELKVFSEIIRVNSNSELHSARIRNKKLADCADPVETRFLEVLRLQTKEKCSIKMKQLMEASLPKLHLQKLKPEPFKKLVHRTVGMGIGIRKSIGNTGKKKGGRISTVKPSKISSEPDPQSDIPNVTFSSISSESLAPPISVHPPPESSQAPNITSSIKGRQLLHEICKRKIKKIQPGDRYHCTICKSTFLPKGNKFRTHIVNTHPDTVFATKRPPHLTPQHFNVICQRILIEETSHASQKCSSTDKQSYICKICNRKYNYGHDFRYHLVLEHYPIMEEKLLEQLPKKAAIPNEKKTPIPTAGPTLPRGRPRKIIPSPTKNGRRPNVIWACSVAGGGCGRKFQNRMTLTKHLKESCSLIKNRQLWTRTAKQRKPLKKPTGPGRPELPTPKTKVKKVGTILGKYCGRVETRYKGSNAFRCLVCKDFKKGYFKSAIHKHLVNLHPEKFFGGKKFPELSQEKFKICCRRLLTLETKEAEYQRNKDKSSSSKDRDYRARLCPICQWKANDSFNLRYHMMLEHFKILEGKLTGIQEEMVGNDLNSLGMEGGEGKVKRKRKRKIKEVEGEAGSEEVVRKRARITVGKMKKIREVKQKKKAEREKLTLVLKRNENGQFTKANSVPRQRREESRQEVIQEENGGEMNTQNENGEGMEEKIAQVEGQDEIGEEREETVGQGERQEEETDGGDSIPILQEGSENNTENVCVLSSSFYDEEGSQEGNSCESQNTPANNSYDFNTESTMEIEVEDVFMSIVDVKPDINQLEQNL